MIDFIKKYNSMNSMICNPRIIHTFGVEIIELWLSDDSGNKQQRTDYGLGGRNCYPVLERCRFGADAR